MLAKRSKAVGKRGRSASHAGQLLQAPSLQHCPREAPCFASSDDTFDGEALERCHQCLQRQVRSEAVPTEVVMVCRGHSHSPTREEHKTAVDAAAKAAAADCNDVLVERSSSSSGSRRGALSSSRRAAIAEGGTDGIGLRQKCHNGLPPCCHEAGCGPSEHVRLMLQAASSMCGQYALWCQAPMHLVCEANTWHGKDSAHVVSAAGLLANC